MSEKKKWSPLDGDRPKPGTPEGEEYETRHITPGPERERELARRKKEREEKTKLQEGSKVFKKDTPENKEKRKKSHKGWQGRKKKWQDDNVNARDAVQDARKERGEDPHEGDPRDLDESAKKKGRLGESTNNKFDRRLEAVYKSLMSEDATDTAAETTEKQASAISAAHAKKSLARKAMDALTGNQDGDIADAYDELQTAKKTNLLPALKDELAAVQALGK